MENHILLDNKIKIELTQEQVEQLKSYHNVSDDKNLLAVGEYCLVLNLRKGE